MYYGSCIFDSDGRDFDNSTITATFPADEGGNATTDLVVPIPVFDDDVDEANNQYFIIKLVVVNAINTNLTTLTQEASRCIIIDNDCEYNSNNKFIEGID